MVKLEITIKEKNSLNFKEISATHMEISIQEIGKKATKGEKEVCNSLKKQLKVDEKFQDETEKDKLKADLEKILKSL